jgi:HK97 gp10 family phage protein
MTPEELAQQFEKAGKDFEALKVKLMTRIVISVEGNAKREWPVGAPRKYSTLALSITHRVESTGDHGVVGTNIEYARFVHDGTSKMPARPFFKTALAASRGTIDELIQQAGDELMARIAKQ